MTWHVGDTVRAVATFTDASGVPVAPGSVVMLVRNPVGTVATIPHASITRIATGVYQAEQHLDQAGEWAFRFAGLGTGRAAEEFTLNVPRSLFAG